MRIFVRVVAFILGLVASALALVADVAYSTVHRISGALGSASIDQTHGLVGLALVVVGVIGSILALFSPTVAAVLLLVAGIGMFFVVKAYAVFSFVLFVLAAILAFAERSPRRARPPSTPTPGS